MPGEAALTESWFFGCSACGKCCNSPPRLLLPELLRHEQRFVGCLGVRRGAVELELFVHAFGFESLGDCPALRSDGRCSLHEQGKPQVCSIVPLEPTASDAEQGAVLRARRGEARYLGADCIRDRPAPGFRELVRQLRVVDPEAEAALGRYRQAQSGEDLFWRRATHDWLASELGPAAVPAGGALALSLAPVLLHVARGSETCQRRIEQFLRAQAELMRAEIAAALERRDTRDRKDTAVLRGFLQQAEALAQRLHSGTSSQRWPVDAARELERWLGLNTTA